MHYIKNDTHLQPRVAFVFKNGLLIFIGYNKLKFYASCSQCAIQQRVISLVLLIYPFPCYLRTYGSEDSVILHITATKNLQTPDWLRCLFPDLVNTRGQALT